MDHYVGIDVSCKSSVVCIVDSRGSQVLKKTVGTTVSAIAKCLASSKLAIIAVGIETGTECHHLARGLKECGYDIQVIDARKASAMMDNLKTNKTDENDAYAIAQILRTNMHSSIHVKSSDQLDVLALLNSRAHVVGLKTGLGNLIRGLAKAHGIKSPSKFDSSAWRSIINDSSKASQLLKRVLLTLLNLYDNMSETITSCDAMVDKQVKGSKKAQLLMTAPGVGPLLSLTFLASIPSGTEFTRSRDIGAYFGMTPKEYSSGQTVFRGRISKRGPEYARQLLMQSGLNILIHSKKDTLLKKWAMSLKHRKHNRVCAVAVGRKLAVILWRMLQTGKEFQIEQPYKAA